MMKIILVFLVIFCCLTFSTCTPETPEFLPFGVENGDVQVAAGSPTVGPIGLQPPLILYGNAETEFYISPNGVISFGMPFHLSELQGFDERFSQDFNHPVVAPMWANFNVPGTVYYRTTRNEDALKDVARMIREANSNFGGFSPTYAAVISWENAVTAALNVTTFQAVMTTDGTASYIFFIYDTTPLPYPYVTGFSAGDGHRYSDIITPPAIANIFRVEGNCTYGITPEKLCPLLRFNPECFEHLSITMNTDCRCGTGSGAAAYTGLFPSYGGDLERTSHLAPVSLGTSIPLYSSVETQFYISRHGYITFEPIRSSSPVLEIRSFTSTQLEPAIIAPYWHVIPHIERIWYRVSRDTRDLYHVVSLLSSLNPSLCDFHPTTVVVVTWQRYSSEANNYTSLPTFQLVLASDGRSTFAFFLFDDLVDLTGDYVRSHVSTGFSKPDETTILRLISRTLNRVNIYRVEGECVTGVLPNQTCPLDASVYECAAGQQVATRCICDNITSESNNCLDFYPFGIRNGDTEVPRAVDRVVGPFTLPVPVLYYMKKEFQYYVSNNGLILFGESFTRKRLNALPDFDVPVIAPLWADFDFRDSGNVYHRASQDQTLLDAVASRIHETNPSYSDFRPTLCIVVTWFRARLFSGGFSSHENIFQAVLSTDGRRSFAFLLYYNSTLIRSITRPINGIVGFDAGDQERASQVLRGFYVVQRGFSNFNSYRIDGNCITTAREADTCDFNSTVIGCDSPDSLGRIQFRSLECLCPRSSTDTRCHLTNFFPFGILNGDSKGPTGVDLSTMAAPLPVPITFYNTPRRNLFISTNGLLSFDAAFDEHSIQSFPKSADPLLPLIAPLWADLNFRDSGAIFYRIVSDVSTLSEVATLIAEQNDIYRSFSPTMAVIVTWFQGGVLGTYSVFQNFRLIRRPYLTEINVQAVLVTDGTLSFAIFLYDRLNYIFPRVIGFDAGDSFRGAYYEQGGNLLFQATQNGTLWHPPEAGRASNPTITFRIDGRCVLPAGFDTCGVDAVPLNCPFNPDRSPAAPICTCTERSGDNSSCVGLLNFGPLAGDATHPNISFSLFLESLVINLPVPIVFYGVNRTFLEVFRTGFIALEFGITGSNELPIVENTTQVPLIVPLWTPISAEGGSKIIYYRTADDPGTLSQVVDLLSAQNRELEGFRPQLAVIITFVSLGYRTVNGFFGFILPVDELDLTYQCVLATDGNNTIAAFHYADPEKINSDSYREIRQVGFARGYNHFDLVLDYNTTGLPEFLPVQVFRVDGDCITSASRGSMCALNSVTSQCSDFTATLCSCKEGYVPVNDLTCIDVDECEENANLCGDNSVCINLPGTFQCVCNPGYTGNSGANCVDIDECSLTVSLHDCEQGCVNTIGGFNCTCDEGYLSPMDNGYNCADIDECLVGSPCSEDAECTNYIGSYTCSCNAGFSGDGVICLSVGVAVDESDDVPAVVGGSVAGFVVLLVIVLLLVGIYLSSKRKERKRRDRELLLRSNSEYGENNYFMNMVVKGSVKHNIPKHIMIASANLDLGKTIGQGEFGIVYKGHLKSGFADRSSQPVAVKTLKGFIHQELVDELLKECAKMHEFDHPNVLRMIGVCLDGGPAPYIIMPYMANGSLLSYLKEERANLILDPDSASPDEAADVEKKLLDISIQVAKGMEYLVGKRVIHRDLAARNCMIDTNFVIKVADFGLAESMDTTKEYFRQDQESTVKLPVKWLAPESMLDGIFSEKTDVWSYGVTCWEVFAGGKAPYPGIHPHEIAQKLETGYRMKQPANAACSDDVYALMLRCWDSQPDARPSFTDVVNHLSGDLATKAGYLEFSFIS